MDGQWIDFYALLEVPLEADEAALRKRIGQAYGDASANAEHRDPQKRAWSQALCEHILPQARRVLLDAAWRAHYDHQNALHARNDAAAQSFVAFMAAGRSGTPIPPDGDESLLPTLVQKEMSAAREVLECARAGLQLELLPSQAVRSAAPAGKSSPATGKVLPATEKSPAPAGKVLSPTNGSSSPSPAKPVEAKTPAPPAQPLSLPAQPLAPRAATPSASASSQAESDALRGRPPIHAPLETQQGEPVRLQTLTAQEANALRRQGARSADDAAPVSSQTTHAYVAPRPTTARVVVGEKVPAKRKLSPTSLHLLVAITGVFLTLSIQRFSATPASATSGGRIPLLVATSPEMTGVLEQVQAGWNRAGEDGFDLVVQSAEGEGGVRRVLGKGGNAPDLWMPSSKAWLDRYNALAPRMGHEPLAAGESVASTPVVLIARGEHAGELERRFPDHRVPSWSALREAVAASAPGRFGLSDPQQTAVGALARFSMAREWAQGHAQTPAAAVKSPAFWNWMNGFEANTPSAYSTSSDLVNDLRGGDASRLWWGLAYESDAIAALNAGQNVGVWYLPRTILADHPFYALDRVGAPLEVASGRASLKRFLLSDDGQKTLLLSGMRPARLPLGFRLAGNPFTNASFSKRGLRATLPRDERSGSGVLASLSAEWAKRFK